MKKTCLFFTLILLVSTILPAQNNFRVGIRGGLNLNSVIFSGPDGDYYNGAKQDVLGFHIGLVTEIPIRGRLAIRTGIDGKSMGFTLKETEPGVTTTYTSHPIYLQVPVVLAYNGRLVYFGAGPYVGLGVAGKYKITYRDPNGNPFLYDYDEEGDLEYGKTAGRHYTSYDFGLVAEAGVKISILRIGLSYAAGLIDILPRHAVADAKTRHAVLAVTVGLMFGL